MTIAYKGIQIYFTDQGAGKPTVLLHGFLENSTMWHAFVPELAKNNRIICIDLLGHGNTECLGYVHSMELMAETVYAVLKHLKIEKTAIIGHSMGGYVALAFAEKNPDMLNGLCLMNSTALADSEEKKQNRNRAILAVKQNYKTFIRVAINNLFRPKNRLIYAPAIKEVINEALKTPLQGIIAALEGMKIRADRQHILQTSHFKKMMIVSKKDPVLDYDTIINQTKNTETTVIEFPDGHMSHIENEASLFTEIQQFIETI